MSLSYTNLEAVKMMDPKINIIEDKQYVFKRGPNNVSFNQFTATSATSSNASFTCTPPSPDIVISPLVYMKARVNVSITGTATDNAGANLTQVDMTPYFPGDGGAATNFICLRQFPLASVMKTLTVKLNGDSVTTNPSDYINALGHFNITELERAYEMSSSPSQPDMYQKYNDMTGLYEVIGNGNGGAAAGPPIVLATAVPGTQGSNYGGARSPFADYGQNTNEMPRGSYEVIDVAYDAASGITTATFEIIEPLFISPLSSGKYNIPGLTQIKNCDITMVFDNQMSRIISVDKASLTNQSVTVNGNVLTQALRVGEPTVQLDRDGTSLLFTYFTPQIDQPLPKNIIYPYQELQTFSQEDFSLAGGASVSSKQSNNIVLSSIPDKIYVFARERQSTRNAFTTDTYARISKCNIQFNGKDGLLSNASEIDLWRISCSNGLKLSFPQWTKYVGSILCIDPVANLGLSANQAAGLVGNYNFSVRVDLQNLSTVQRDMELVILVDQKGILTISNGKIIRQLSVMSSLDVINKGDEISEVDANSIVNAEGGNFITGAKNVYHNLRKFKNKHQDAINKGLNLADSETAHELVGMVAPRVGEAYKLGTDWAKHLLGTGAYTNKQIKLMKASGYSNKDFEKLYHAGNVVGSGFDAMPIGRGVVGGRIAPKNKLKNRMNEYY